MNDSYELIDSGNFQKLEQVGPYRLVRPSPQAVWQPRLDKSAWNKVDGKFIRDKSGGGRWSFSKQVLKDRNILLKDIKFAIKFNDFGHIGIFPEQQTNWERIYKEVSSLKKRELSPKVLNLFAYTGGSTMAALRGGAHVVHNDASKISISWAKENCSLNVLDEMPIRWILEDVKKFIAREVRRGSKYHGIILDPPSFGRGNKGEVWKIEDDMCNLLSQLKNLLDDDFSFFSLSSHSNGYTPRALENLVSDIVQGTTGSYISEEMLLHEVDSNRSLPSGSTCFFKRG